MHSLAPDGTPAECGISFGLICFLNMNFIKNVHPSSVKAHRVKKKHKEDQKYEKSSNKNGIITAVTAQPISVFVFEKPLKFPAPSHLL